MVKTVQEIYNEYPIGSVDGKRPRDKPEQIKYAIKERLKPQISKVLRNWSVFSLQSKKKSLEKE
jgi:hypothetical protein